MGEGQAALNGAAKKTGSKVQEQRSLGRDDVARIQKEVQSGIGRLAVAMAGLPRYRTQQLSDLPRLILDPLVRDRILATTLKRKPNGDEPQDEEQLEATAGFAIWASVSDAVNTKIQDQVKSRVFPTILKPDEWTSGETIWLLDVIAPTKQLAQAVLKNFATIAKDKSVSVHPIVAESVGKDMIEQMKVAQSGEGKSNVA